MMFLSFIRIIKIIEYDIDKWDSDKFPAENDINYLCKMNNDFLVPEPFLFNPLKHHVGYIKEFVIENSREKKENLIKELKHLGNSVMDVYTGKLSLLELCLDIETVLKNKFRSGEDEFSRRAGFKNNSYGIITISDGSQWILKYYRNRNRFIHFFPARYSPMTIRIKSNTLKSALLYIILVGKDFISGEDLNNARLQIGLSPIKDPEETEAITEMIELLRSVE